MTAERLRNRLAKIEGRLAPHSFVVYVEDAESEHYALAHTGVLGTGRCVALMPRPCATVEEWLLTTGRCFPDGDCRPLETRTAILRVVG
jgi:hypothetical protein